MWFKLGLLIILSFCVLAVLESEAVPLVSVVLYMVSSSLHTQCTLRRSSSCLGTVVPVRDSNRQCGGAVALSDFRSFMKGAAVNSCTALNAHV